MKSIDQHDWKHCPVCGSTRTFTRLRDGKFVCLDCEALKEYLVRLKQGGLFLCNSTDVWLWVALVIVGAAVSVVWRMM